MFKRIKKHKEITDKDKYRYIYFGKGQVFRKQNGDYNIVFSENFDGSIKKVKCVLSEKMIEDCMFGKTNKLDMLNSAIGKEKYIYVFASKNISEKYKMAYLNVKNLDCNFVCFAIIYTSFYSTIYFCCLCLIHCYLW